MPDKSGRSRYMVWLVMLTFFVISLITNIFGPLIPDIITGFHLSLTAAAFLPFCFFIAYGALSIPAGFEAERSGEKRVMMVSFLLAFAGAITFAALPRYGVAVASLFVIGGSFAALQVVINPLLRVAGGEEHFAYNSTLAQFVFGAASFLSPYLYSAIVETPGRSSAPTVLRGLVSLAPPGLPWVSLYWVFAFASLLMTAVIVLSRFPRVERTPDEQAGTIAMYRDLLRQPVVVLYFISVFLYVGSEQGTANWISEFLARYHRFDPHTVGAAAVAWFWGLMTAGCFAGMLLLKFFDSRKVLFAFSVGAIVSLTVALFGSGGAARFAFPIIGLFASVMWPVIISLALNSVSVHHGPFSGILCAAIMGGAVMPLLIGAVADALGLRAGMCLLYVTFGWILGVSVWARPLISNETIRNKSSRQAA